MAIESILAAGGGTVEGIGNIVFGAIDRTKSKKIRKQPLEEWKKMMGFQEYEVPEAYEQYRDLLGLQRRQEMPGMTEQKQLIEEGTAATLSGAQNLDTGSAAAVLLGAGQDRLRALRQLGIAASQYRDTAQQRYAQAVGQGAQYQQQAYEYNRWLPWQMKMNEAMAYRGAGTQQIMSGMDAIGAAGVQYANLQAQQDWFNRMYPQQGSTQAQPPVYPWQQYHPQFYNTMNTMGQQQVAPATNLGTDPYWNQ